MDYNRRYTLEKNPAGVPVGDLKLLINYFMLYFFLNLSTRPPASTSFCLPVKKGWHLEQISTLMSFLVERVSNVAPHAHFIVVAS